MDEVYGGRAKIRPSRSHSGKPLANVQVGRASVLACSPRCLDEEVDEPEGRSREW